MLFDPCKARPTITTPEIQRYPYASASSIQQKAPPEIEAHLEIGVQEDNHADEYVVEEVSLGRVKSSSLRLVDESAPNGLAQARRVFLEDRSFEGTVCVNADARALRKRPKVECTKSL